ncbi:unnamed protein product [Mesocestoides corti]|uniref:EF-hand domain-containing protein n=1 Tax=Mesocestoides corti TaxID=53468 RepID=A0A0R3U2F2_MESCO|nr:unnamed protein product [Mesocestoides corti]
MPSRKDVVEFLKSLDRDKSGTVSAKELLTAFEGHQFSVDELKAFIAVHDKDGDGELDVDELVAFFNSSK